MEFEAIFKALDKDNSGEIDVQELKEYMKQQNLPSHFVERWQAAFDLDMNGSISIEEFRKVLGLQPRRDYMAFFRKADKDGQGVVTVKALREIFHQEGADDVYEMYFKDCPDDGELKLDEYRSKMDL